MSLQINIYVNQESALNKCRVTTFFYTLMHFKWVVFLPESNQIQISFVLRLSSHWFVVIDVNADVYLLPVQNNIQVNRS